MTYGSGQKFVSGGLRMRRRSATAEALANEGHDRCQMSIPTLPVQKILIFTARRYERARHMLSPCVRVSVCHKSEF